MGFSSVNDKELNIDKAKSIIDSILNVGEFAFLVVDKHTFEIVYENNLANVLIGDKIGKSCYEIFYTASIPCIDCPIINISDEPAVVTRYSDFFDNTVKLRLTKINWFDSREAILITILSIGEDGSYTAPATSGAGYNISDDKRQTDSLTGIPNRTRFCNNAENTFKCNTDKNYAIVVFDVWRLKSINDIYGMQMGDEVLKMIATSMQQVFMLDDNYARLHSDVFAFYLAYEKKGDIVKAIEKLRKQIASNDYEFDVNTSYGIYLVEDRDVPINLMCDRAGMARKTIKDNVLKFCAFYDEQYRAEMLRTNEIERDMYKALADGQFKMYLQPKYMLKDNSLCGAEVLCRWLHPVKGLIPPNDFIPLFEKNGFILKLDEYMWEQACQTLRGWLDEGREPVPLSVNISRYHIRHNDLVAVFTRLLDKYGLTSDMLTLEITESLFLDKPEELNHVLSHLQAMGFKLEVDDFGSGFSSLNLIRNIAVDTIKIDKDFLDSEISSEKGKIVVNHTISMAKDLQLQVVAEGVETKEHVDFLKGSACDIAQGFYFAKPMPLEKFNELSF